MARRPFSAFTVPVAISFFLLTNVVFCAMFRGWYGSRRLLAEGQTVSAIITHKWKASRWPGSKDVYIGYAYVDGEGVEHKGSARICGEGASLYAVGQPLDVWVDRQAPERSALKQRTYLSSIDRMSSSLAMTTLTGVLALFGWWLLVTRLKRTWDGLWRAGQQTGRAKGSSEGQQIADEQHDKPEGNDQE